MSASLYRAAAVAFLALIAGLVGAATAAAQTRDGRDLLDQVRRLKEVAAQKLEADVRDALRQAQAEPARAAVILKQTLAVLEQDTALTLERREALKQLVKGRLRAAEGTGTSERPGEDPGRPIADVNRRAEEQARAQEREQIERSLTTIRSLQVQGKYPEADRMARDLARQYPNNPAAVAAARIGPAADRAMDLRNLRVERERRMSGALTQVEIAAIPAAGDYVLPPDWREKSERRAKSLVKLTPKEQAIVDALNSPVSVDFKDSRFEDVIKKLEEVSGQTILLDKQSLDEAQVTYETPVKLQLRHVTFRTALRKVLADHGLTYVVKDQTIQVMTLGRAKELMSVKAYYIGDLLVTAGVPLPPGLTQLQMAQNVALVIDLIKRTIDPESWQPNGPGSITFEPLTMSLVIKQSAEMHLVIGSGISGGGR